MKNVLITLLTILFSVSLIACAAKSPLSPGSSGGGLFDSEGNLIGILTEKIVDEDAEGLGFAIPADLAL